MAMLLIKKKTEVVSELKHSVQGGLHIISGSIIKIYFVFISTYMVYNTFRKMSL